MTGAKRFGDLRHQSPVVLVTMGSGACSFLCRGGARVPQLLHHVWRGGRRRPFVVVRKSRSSDDDRTDWSLAEKGIIDPG